MSSEPTSFLYPFIESEERDSSGLLVDLAHSAQEKISQSWALRAATIERCHDQLGRAAPAMAECFTRGGRLFAFGNGGSATDAEGTVDLFRHPPHGRPLPAMSLVDDRAVLTALANDVGFDLVFSRQIIAHARAGDIAVGFSTSGDSRNVLRGLEEASHRGLLTVGLSGYEGGAIAASAATAHCLVVRSESVHRIQEAQNALMLQLWSLVQGGLDEGGTE
ncbi:MAG TPA: SIS domain-containing protein [Acidimicrobiales bacterium]|jgi:D-sedoheptulose 7-phosphate isomerase|nr:SIS domain-containing protein [Acidimicrobiales bacterium]